MASNLNRRDFVKAAGIAGVASAALKAAAKPLNMMRPAAPRVMGANDRINLGFIGCGGRSHDLLREFSAIAAKDDNVKIVAVCDVYEKRKKAAADKYNAQGYLDYREVLGRSDIDAVVIATPDHWHAPIALAAMKANKDVYLEKPMTHTVDEAREVYEATVKYKRVLQVGSQTTSSDQWWKARKAIQDGMIGKMILSQGSYHRNSTKGEWNYDIDAAAGPNGKGEDYIDWKMWLGSAPKMDYNADRFFRFRKYWDYSGGIATDLFYHVMAPMNLVWGGGEFPWRVVATGGIYVFKDEREVPDTFMLTADYPSGHSVVLSSSMANSTHIPGLIRGHDGTIMMVENGQFESRVDHITVTPQKHVAKDFEAKYGGPELKIMVEPRVSHYQNFIDCVRSREKPVLDALTAYKAMTTIAMSVDSYRRGQMLYFDRAKQKVTDKPIPRPAEGE
jgi:predicted dehydrogenase